MIFWYLLALTIIMIWTIIMMAIFYSRFREPLEKRGFALSGPFLLWKTVRGKQFIEKIAKREKSVELYGRIAVAITGVSMVVMTIFLFYSAFLVIRLAKHIVLEPHMLLGLPGLNPLIPLWYGIFALVIAVVVHEFSHGILSALAKVKILSLGILFFVFPMGAFVEPDEEQLKKVEKKKRVRMFAAGPAANIIVAGICTLIFSMVLMSGVQPVAEGVGITDVTHGSAAYVSGIEEGYVMVSFNGIATTEYSDFSRAVGNTRANQTVVVGLYDPDLAGETRYVHVTLTDKSLITLREEDAGKGFFGVSTMTITTAHFHPIGGAEELGGVARSISTYVVLPLQRLSPVQEPTTNFYEVTGFWSFLPTNVFWIISNAFYWVFWLNLMVGLTNALPAVPLDGGYIFKDWLDTLVKGRKMKKAKAETRKLRRRLDRAVKADSMTRPEADELYGKGLVKIVKKHKDATTTLVNRTAFLLALSILILILWQVIGPRLLTVI